jgi:DNA helicase-2/ATP-dependent DNA helicase PcrA
MLQGINITEEDIRYTEKILLPEGKTFDDERRTFIKNLETLDLQAVPGSGKTTALLAKLLILEQKLPFQDGSGILVLSHTNAAIDEIKHKIQKYCPKLFVYPNFVGTIQSFVDEFLAIPYYVQKFKKKPIRIDSEIFDEIATNYFNGLPNSSSKSWLMRQHNPENIFKNLRFDVDLNLLKGMNGTICLRSDSNSATYKTFKTIKYKILKSGFLNFDDAYFFAERYLKHYPEIKNILQKRFSYVFVDEMQDMDTHQYNLLEKIFYDEGNSISMIQRIGDKNQAIYNSVKTAQIWNDREIVLKLSGSQRLSKPIADVVKKFALYTDADFDIVGLNECVIKPHIIVFENGSINNIISRFAQIVRDCKENGCLEGKNIKVICWNTEWGNQADIEDDSKLRLTDYHSDFKKEKSKPKQDYDCLKSYLMFYDKNKETLEPLRKNILNAFLKILRLENIKGEDGRPFTKKKMIDFVREKDITLYDQFNLCIYNWSMGIINGEVKNTWIDIREYVPSFFAIFSQIPLSTSLIFINNDVTNISSDDIIEPENTNYYKEDGIEIEITSVHSVKGQTHCATLYLESYFQKDGTGANAKSYESQRLTEQFLGIPIKISNIGDRVKQSAKMAYVGFSRPTNLLCVAIHKDRFDKYLQSIDTNVWEIIHI